MRTYRILCVPNILFALSFTSDIFVEKIMFWFMCNNNFRPKYGISEQRTGYKGVMRLTVRAFSSADVGTYHCVSTNSLGRAEGTLRLYGKLVFITIS